MADVNQKVNMNSFMKHITLNVTFTGVRRVNARLRIAKIVMQTAAWIAGMHCHVAISSDEAKR